MTHLLLQDVGRQALGIHRCVTPTKAVETVAMASIGALVLIRIPANKVNACGFLDACKLRGESAAVMGPREYERAKTCDPAQVVNRNVSQVIDLVSAALVI
jgi:hypothetical protein